MNLQQKRIQTLALEIEEIASTHKISRGVYTLLRDGINLVFKNQSN